MAPHSVHDFMSWINSNHPQDPPEGCPTPREGTHKFWESLTGSMISEDLENKRK